jgi:hypothetical protein
MGEMGLEIGRWVELVLKIHLNEAWGSIMREQVIKHCFFFKLIFST